MATRRGNTVFSDFLMALGVPFTPEYSDTRYAAMPFKTLFGFVKLLQEYGIESEGYKLDDRSEIAKITPPFLARLNGGFVIVTGMDKGEVTYETEGEAEHISMERFVDAWCGNVLIAYPDEHSREPDYAAHARAGFFMESKKYVLAACALFLFVYLFVSRGLYACWSTVFLVALDLCGLWLTYMLVRKSLKIKSRSADKVCGVIEEGGCDSILETKASKFFGLFGWSEVGFAYFSVSMMALLLFPNCIGFLAVCNACCLPFTVWSIWYQKYRAKVWCTLCVCVQCTLWLSFFCYLAGGWFGTMTSPYITLFVLGAAYIAVLLALNRMMPFFDNSDSA